MFTKCSRTAAEVEAGVLELADRDGDVADKVVHREDAQVREQPLEKPQQQIFVLLRAQEVLEAPVGGRVNEPLVFVVDEVAVLSCHSANC